MAIMSRLLVEGMLHTTNIRDFPKSSTDLGRSHKSNYASEISPESAHKRECNQDIQKRSIIAKVHDSNLMLTPFRPDLFC